MRSPLQRLQLIPFFLANFVDATSHPRRIYIDLGVATFDSSICWMMQHYPVKFDRIYGFECAQDYSNTEALAPNVESCMRGTGAESTGYIDASQVIKSISLYHNYVGVNSIPNTSPPTVGLGHFMKDMDIREEDFVVMKMDVEGMEYDLIERMLEDGTHESIDEVRPKQNKGD